jgi:hypothetical protein
MDTHPESVCTFPQNTFPSFSTTYFGAQRRPRSPRSRAQHRQTQTLRGVSENSGVGRPLAADQRRSTDVLAPSSLTTPNIAPSTQPIAPTPIPDLTKFITRCSPYPICGGTYGNIYKCVYHGPEGDVEVRADVRVLPRSLTQYSPAGCCQSDSTTIRVV